MRFYIKKLLIILLINIIFIINAEDIILDKIEILDNNQGVIRIHNIDNPNDVKLSINDKLYNKFTIDYKKIKSYFIILLDNSGSIALNDFLEIRDRVVYLLNNLDKENDLIKIYKINDTYDLLFPTTKFQDKMINKISTLQREGKKSRIFEAVNDALKEANQLFTEPEYQDFDFYVMLFSDADENVNPLVELYKNSYIPFFYFSYFSKAEQFKAEKLINLSKESKGNTLHMPTYDNINELFFKKQKRYEVTLNLPLNKKEILKSKQYFITVIENNKKLIIDLKKYFQQIENNQNANLKNNDNINIENNDNKELVNNTNSQQSNKNETKTNNIHIDKNNKIKEKELINNITINNNNNINDGSNNQIQIILDFVKDNLILFVFTIFIILLILLVILFLKKILSNKEKNIEKNSKSRGPQDNINEFETSNNYKTTKDNKIQNTTQTNKILNNEAKKEEKNKNDDINKEEKEKEEAINELAKKDFVTIKYIKDNLFHNKISKFQLIYNRSANYVDEEEHSGEQVLIESKLDIIDVENNCLSVKTDIPLLIENSIKLKNISFTINSIEYDIDTQLFKYTLLSNNNDKLEKYFSSKDSVLGERTLDLFGKATALVEKNISKHIEKERIKINSTFETKLYKESESTYIELNYDIPVDTILEIYNDENNKYTQFLVKKVLFKNGKYKVYLG